MKKTLKKQKDGIFSHVSVIYKKTKYFGMNIFFFKFVVGICGLNN
jgi:hypothetical protein